MKIQSNKLFDKVRYVKYKYNDNAWNEYLLLQFISGGINGTCAIVEVIHGDEKGQIREINIRDLKFINKEDK